ncbi:hypothetical protein ACN38_g9853 [Penicillium nordicum]|uniref:Uncharacterized protein n=1 Tax=Penicillium nordicum TaxID=229535 RepID=A0A0M8P2Y9_9EURO|nr:hypothetical protein ACN38_g9853 [Penicillium nordicum]
MEDVNGTLLSTILKQPDQENMILNPNIDNTTHNDAPQQTPANANLNIKYLLYDLLIQKKLSITVYLIKIHPPPLNFISAQLA